MKEKESKSQILKTKLSIPYLPDSIQRERFNSFFDEIRQKKVSLVIAGAGYGKTTLMVQACQYLDLDTVWYRLDETDNDFLTFIHYIIDGIRHYYGEIGKETLNRINQAQMTKEEQQGILTILLNEIEETVDKELLILLDDFHSIHETSEVLDALTFFIQHLPNKIHLIIISRTDPDLNLSQHKARREAVEIREKDITFNIDEVELLYTDIFNISLTRKDLMALCEKMNGWISGLVLFHHSLKEQRKKNIEKQLNDIKGTKKIVFEYLEKNVLNKLPDKSFQFMIKTSILSRLDVSFCDQFLKINNSKKILEDLVKKHLFVFSFDEEGDSYYYHQLLKDYLMEKMGRLFDSKTISNIHDNAGLIHEKRGESEEAIFHYINAGQYEYSCKLLMKMSQEMIQKGRINLFISCFNGIPDIYIENEPWLRIFYGSALMLSGKTIDAIEVYEHARIKFSENKMQDGEGLCLKNLAFIYLYQIGDLKAAEERLKELILKFKDIQNLYVEALTQLIFLASCSTDFEKADQYYGEAIKAIKDNKDPKILSLIYINCGFRYIFSGDLIKAKDFSEMAMELAERMESYYMVMSICHLVSMTWYYMGDFSKGLEIALKGTYLAEEMGFLGNAPAWDYIAACLCAAEMGKTTEAITYGQKALTVGSGFENIWVRVWAQYALGNAWLKAGDLTRAEESARSAVHTIQRMALPGDEGIIYRGLAEILIEKGQLDEGCQLLEKAAEKLANLKIDLTLVKFSLSRAYLLKGQKKKSIETYRFALMLSKENGYDRWVLQNSRWAIPLFLEVYHDKALHGYLKTLIPQFDKEIAGFLRQIQRDKKGNTKKAAEEIITQMAHIPPPGLRVMCFGKFRLFKGNREIYPEDWKSEKAKSLFEYLVFNHTRGYLQKDVLLELLWPDQDPALTHNRLRVAFTTIRKTLEPELPRGKASSYILRKGDAYRLDPGNLGYVDFISLDQEVAFIEKNQGDTDILEHCLAAEKIYRGDLYEENRYAQWCIDARDEYKEKYLDLLRLLISLYEKKKDTQKCIQYTRKYLEHDEYAEDAYQSLMKFYGQTGKRAMVIKTFEQCQRKIETELQCPLAKETTDIYKHIITS